MPRCRLTRYYESVEHHLFASAVSVVIIDSCSTKPQRLMNHFYLTVFTGIFVGNWF